MVLGASEELVVIKRHEIIGLIILWTFLHLDNSKVLSNYGIIYIRVKY